MNEIDKHVNAKFIHRENPIFQWLLLISGVLTICSMVLPFGSYTQDKAKVNVTGLQLLTGTVIENGKKSFTVSPNFFVILGLIASIALIVLCIGFYKSLTPRKAGLFSLILGFVRLFVGIVLIITMTTAIIADGKKPKMAFGTYCYLFTAILTIIFAYAMLYQNKAVSVLDFMVMPGLVYVLINNYIPMVGISFAFKKIDYSIGVWRSGWVGFSNFKFLFQSSDSVTITKNTLLYNLVFILLGNILGVVVGICLSEIFSKKLQKLYQTTILLPQLISWVIVAYIAYGFLSNEAGWINKTVLGAGNEINFYGTTKFWPFILVFFHLWKGLGYNSIIYLSSIVGIDRNLYEAASIDGCSKFGTIRHITLPLLKSTVITLVTLAVGRIFYSDFGLFYQVPMNSGSLYSVTDTIDTYVYRALMQLNNISMASAASAYQAIVGFILVLIFNLIVNKVSKENALF